MNVSFSHFVTFTIIHLSSSELAFIVFIALYCNDGLLSFMPLKNAYCHGTVSLLCFGCPVVKALFYVRVEPGAHAKQGLPAS